MSGVLGGLIGSTVPARPAVELIQTVITSTSPTLISFNSIPSTFSHLQLRISGSLVNNNFNQFFLRFNGAESEYAWSAIIASGASVSGQATANQTIIMGGPIGNANDAWFNAAIIDILDYATSNKNPTIRSLGGVAGSGTVTNLRFLAGHLRFSQTPITSISIADTQGFSFANNSRFSLYGIRG